MTTTSNAGRFGKGGAIAIIIGLLMVVPAAAGIIVQNFLRADIEVAAACFTKTDGADIASTTGLIDFDETQTVATAGGVNLLQERATFSAFQGDRMLYTEAVTFNNTCGHDLELLFISAADPAGGAAVEDMAGLDVRFYLPDATNGGAVPGLTGDWTEMLSVVGGTATDGTTAVTLADTATLTMAIVVDADSAAAVRTGADAGIVRWIAQADHG